MLPDLVTLNLFLSAMHRQSLSKGAADCYIGLAAASRRIAILEDIYGVPLFYRSARGVRPTPAGLHLARHARRILGQERLLRAELSDYHEGVKGHVRLHANTSAITQYERQATPSGAVWGRTRRACLQQAGRERRPSQSLV